VLMYWLWQLKSVAGQCDSLKYVAVPKTSMFRLIHHINTSFSEIHQKWEPKSLHQRPNWTCKTFLPHGCLFNVWHSLKYVLGKMYVW
jgi:hypothetical protein